jgi:hypothetical protein
LNHAAAVHLGGDPVSQAFASVLTARFRQSTNATGGTESNRLASNSVSLPLAGSGGNDEWATTSCTDHDHHTTTIIHRGGHDGHGLAFARGEKAKLSFHSIPFFNSKEKVLNRLRYFSAVK